MPPRPWSTWAPLPGAFHHAAYGLGLVPDGQGDPAKELTPERGHLLAFVTATQDLAATVGAGELGPEEVFQPADYRIQARTADPTSVAGSTDEPQPTVVPWPPETGVRLADAATCVVGSGEALAATLTEREHADVLRRGRDHLPGERRRPAARRVLLRSGLRFAQWASPTRSTSPSPRSSATAPRSPRRSGWSGLEGGKLGFWTSSGSGKAKRLKNNPKVTVQPCNSRGKVTEGTTPTDGTAVTATSGPEVDEIQPKIKAKYGVMVSISKFFNSVGALIKRKKQPYGDTGVVITLS